jgi:hypothetical protein
MTLEKLESLVGVMTNDQYERFQAAVINLVKDNGIFTSEEIKMLERKVHHKNKKEGSIPKEEYGFNMMNVPTN